MGGFPLSHGGRAIRLHQHSTSSRVPTMIHSILTVLVLSGLLTVANQSATEAPSGVAPGRVAVTNKAGQSNDMKNDVPRRELQLAQTRPGQSTSSTSSAQQGLGTVYVVP